MEKNNQGWKNDHKNLKIFRIVLLLVKRASCSNFTSNSTVLSGNNRPTVTCQYFFQNRRTDQNFFMERCQMFL